MATSTEIAIATTTLSSAQSTITFSSIPSTYTDLRLVIVGYPVTDLSTFQIRYNGISTTTYSFTSLYGNGSSAASSRLTSSNAIYIGDGFSVGDKNTQPHLYTVDIFSYAGSTYKTNLSTYSGDVNGSGVVNTTVGLWQSTNAITSIAVSLNVGGNIAAGTTATLYGIL